MQKIEVETLEDIAPYVEEHLLPEIQQAVEVCRKSFLDDEFNDMWTFGTQFWRNTWNRFYAVADYQDCPFEVCGKGNEYKLKIGKFVLRHHRINDESKLPSGAKAVKSSAAHIQIPMFEEGINEPIEIDNIVIAIDADIQNGLKEVFVGELVPLSDNPKQFRWENKVSVFLADGAEASNAEIIDIEYMPGFKQPAPIEDMPEVAIELDKSRIDKRNLESDQDS